MPQANVDTDFIIRVERCARTPKDEMGRHAFESARFLPDGTENTGFILNREPWRRAQILVCGENFGCGSSREMAVWALAGMGIRCVIAPSFGDIFHGNCVQNGVLAIHLPRKEVDALLALAADPASATLTVDLERQAIAAWGRDEIRFQVDPMQRKTLLEGLDAIGVTLAREAEIAAWQAADRERRPWIWRLPT
jgi:3-isopropylmalate/(R)-2-methylmalate dehydratase small subunit